MTREQRLKIWIGNLAEDKKDELLLLCVGELIESELFNFYEGYTVPTWDCSGDTIDGTERDFIE